MSSESIWLSHPKASRFTGSLLGCALGDSIGELAFRSPTWEAVRRAISRAELLRYTDDTAMTIAMAESIVQNGTVDAEKLGLTFQEHFLREPWRGYAAGPPTIFAMVEREGITYVEAAHSLFGGQGSYGNGAAMRVAPVGLAFQGSEDLYAMARASAIVTHAHPIGIDGAAIMARAVAGVLSLSATDHFPVSSFIQTLVDFARTAELRDKMSLVKHLLEQSASPTVAATRIGRSVAMHESMPFAIYAFARHPVSYEECLYTAIMHGGDRDTLGAMAGAISGAYLGVEALPGPWLTRLENRQRMQTLALELLEVRPLSQ